MAIVSEGPISRIGRNLLTLLGYETSAPGVPHAIDQTATIAVKAIIKSRM
jgi:hypothetical protein